MECIARKMRREKNNSFGKQKNLKNSKQFKPSSVITYNIYNICNSYNKKKTIEEYNQKSKNANTTKAITQWMRVFCQLAQIRDHPKNTEVLNL